MRLSVHLFYRALAMPDPVSVEKALRVGTATVGVPVMLIMFVPMALFVVFGERFGITGWFGLAAIVGPIALAWLWWSVYLPRWRVWALERVTGPADRLELIARAIEGNLMWAPGHFFERTEIKSGRVRERERVVGWHEIRDSAR